MCIRRSVPEAFGVEGQTQAGPVLFVTDVHVIAAGAPELESLVFDHLAGDPHCMGFSRVIGGAFLAGCVWIELAVDDVEEELGHGGYRLLTSSVGIGIREAMT